MSYIKNIGYIAKHKLDDPIKKVLALILAISLLPAYGIFNNSATSQEAQAAWSLPQYPWTERATTGDYFYDNFENVPKNSVFQLVTSERLTDILASNGNYYILFGGPYQASSQIAFPIINEQAKAKGITKIYVFDPYVDGYQIDITNTAAGQDNPANWGGGSTAVSVGTTGYASGSAKAETPGDVWTILSHWLPAAAFTTGGVLDGFTGKDTALLNVSITDRTSVPLQDGRSLVSSLKLSDADAQNVSAKSTWVNSAASNLSTIFSAAASIRTDWDYLKRSYNGLVNTLTPSASGNQTQEFYDLGGVFRESDFPNGAGFKLHVIDVKEAYNLLNSAGEFPLFFASTACPNTTAIIRQLALAARDNNVPVVYVIDPIIANHLRFSEGANIDKVAASQNVGGTYIRNIATASAYKFNYLYGELVKYFDPGWITENESKFGTVIPYFPNGQVPSTGTTGLSVSPFDASTADGYKVLAAGQVRSAKRLQAPTLLRYNKDAAKPVVGYWLHQDPTPITNKTSLGTANPLTTYTEYMLNISWVEQNSDWTAGATAASSWKILDPNKTDGSTVSLSRAAIGTEATLALVPALVTPVTGITISPATAQLTVGNTQQFSAAVAPSYATNKSVTWSTNNPGVATVNASGLVSVVGAGNATITAVTNDGGFAAASTISASLPVVNTVPSASVSRASSTTNSTTPAVFKITDTANNTGVYLNAAAGVLSNGASLVAQTHTTGAKYATASSALSSVASKFTVFDIAISDGSQPNGKVKVGIPLPDGYSPSRSAVFYISDAGEYTELDAEYIDGVLEFETEHFSLFAVAEKRTKAVTTPAPVTEEAPGDGSFPYVIGAIIAVVAVVALALALNNKKLNKKKLQK